MPRGPQEARLDRAVSGAARSAIQAAENEWRNGARSLDNVAMALEMAGPQVVANFGGTHTGPAAQRAFRQVAEKVRARKEQMEQAADALAQADVAVGEAKQVHASLGALPSEPARPDIAPGTNDADAVRQQRTYSTQLGGYHAAMADREAKAEAAANEMDRVYRDSTATMQQVHGEPDARSGGSGTAGGGGGGASPHRGRLVVRWRLYDEHAGHHQQPTGGPLDIRDHGHRHPARRRTAGCHAAGDHGAGHGSGRHGHSARDLSARDRRCERRRARHELDRCQRSRWPRGRSRWWSARRRCRGRGRGPRWRDRRARLHRLRRSVDRQQRPDRHRGCPWARPRPEHPVRPRARLAPAPRARRPGREPRVPPDERARRRAAPAAPADVASRDPRDPPAAAARQAQAGRPAPGSGRAARRSRPLVAATSVTRTGTTGPTSSSRRRTGSTTRTPPPA